MSVFTDIISRPERGRGLVYDDRRCAVMLSNRPAAAGHALVVPKTEIDHWLDVPDWLRDHLMAVAHLVGRAQQEVWRPERIGVVLAGFEVPHCHVHVIPANSLSDLRLDGLPHVPDSTLEEPRRLLSSAVLGLASTWPSF